MDIISAENGTYIISLPKDEITVYHITKEYVFNLISQVLNIFPLPPLTSAELHEGADSLLIFTVLPRTYYRFLSFEDVISACKYSKAQDSTLYSRNDEYILSVALPDICLSEFADTLPANSFTELHLKEHAKTVISEDAVKFVKNTF